jgi:hypothetical protein
MFIKISAATPATLEDPDNFKAFKVVTSATPPEDAFASFGRLDGGHVWVNPAWLKANGRPDDANWLAGLDKMLSYAKSAGWLDDTGAVRAHIEVTA